MLFLNLFLISNNKHLECPFILIHLGMNFNFKGFPMWQLPLLEHQIAIHFCIHRIASGGYYGFDFVTLPLLQCVERFHRYRSNKKNIIASLLKFAGYIRNYKMLPGNIFGLILKNKMASQAFLCQS